MGSIKLITYFSLLARTAFAFPIYLSLFQPMSFVPFPNTHGGVSEQLCGTQLPTRVKPQPFSVCRQCGLHVGYIHYFPHDSYIHVLFFFPESWKINCKLYFHKDHFMVFDFWLKTHSTHLSETWAHHLKSRIFPIKQIYIQTNKQRILFPLALPLLSWLTTPCAVR